MTLLFHLAFLASVLQTCKETYVITLLLASSRGAPCWQNS